MGSIIKDELLLENENEIFIIKNCYKVYEHSEYTCKIVRHTIDTEAWLKYLSTILHIEK